MHLCVISLCTAQYQQSVQSKILLSISTLLHVKGPLAWAYVKNMLTITDLRLQLFLCVCILYHKVHSIKWDKDSHKGESVSPSVHEYIRRLSLQCKKYWLFSRPKKSLEFRSELVRPRSRNCSVIETPRNVPALGNVAHYCFPTRFSPKNGNFPRNTDRQSLTDGIYRDFNRGNRFPSGKSGVRKHWANWRTNPWETRDACVLQLKRLGNLSFLKACAE